MTTLPNREKTIHEGREDRSFGVRDRLGRTMGGMVRKEVQFFEEVPEGSYGYINITPGQYFVLRVHATRNGIPYGASQPEKRFLTAAERDAAAEAYFVGAAKRALKAAK